MGFVSCVKTVTKHFPTKILKLVQLPEGRSNYFSMMAIKEGVKLLAFTWCDHNRRSFIATASLLAKVDEQQRFYYRLIDQDTLVQVLLSIDMPLAAKIYYAGNGAINFHNCVHCQEVHTKKSIRTKRWDIRTNLGILSMLFTDSWMLYRSARGENLNITS